MSRAFVKENDEGAPADALPERVVSAAPNYVTPRGVILLEARVKALQASRAALAGSADPLGRQRMGEIERDLRYYRAQIARAVTIDPTSQPHDTVHFGATVVLHDAAGHVHTFRLVGDDEADAGAGCISWASPLARLLIGTRAGDRVTWARPNGTTELEVIAITYSRDTSIYDAELKTGHTQ